MAVCEICNADMLAHSHRRCLDEIDQRKLDTAFIRKLRQSYEGDVERLISDLGVAKLLIQAVERRGKGKGK